MKYNHLVYLAVFLSGLSETVHGDYGNIRVQCRVYDSLQSIEPVFSVMYNKVELLRLNSTENKIVGYTEYGITLAKQINEQPRLLHQLVDDLMNGCLRYGEKFLPKTRQTVQPEVILRSGVEASGNQPAMLICSAYDFYPKPIKIFWSRDGEELTSDVTSTEELADGDWYYQIHSHLEYFPKPGEKISCVVQHASFTKPMIYDWDPPPTDSESYKIIIGAVGLSLWVMMTAGGLIYCKIKSTEHVTAAGGPDSRCFQPMQTMSSTEEQQQI